MKQKHTEKSLSFYVLSVFVQTFEDSMADSTRLDSAREKERYDDLLEGKRYELCVQGSIEGFTIIGGVGVVVGVREIRSEPKPSQLFNWELFISYQVMQ